MKNTGSCPKCNSKKIGYLENVIQRTESSMDSIPIRGHCPAPLGVGVTESAGIIKVIRESPVGQLEAYFCSACGFYETYIKNPTSVQFETIRGFQWVNPES